MRLPSVAFILISPITTRDGAQAEALAYVEIRVGNQLLFGAARDGSSLLASLKAVTSAVNRASRLGLLSVVNAAVPS